VSQPRFDSAKYRQALGHFPTGVTVVTACDAGVPVGLAVGSFSSLSLEPPLVLFCPGNTSSSWPRIREAGVFCVNILGDDQTEVCRVMASKDPDKFAKVPWSTAVTGSPVIDGVLAWIDCTITEVLEGGDHHIVIGRVEDLGFAENGGPLVFSKGTYGRFSS
jgi:3-hydroxy-9,10-secoandrosta-1,3,5(10)-triene-9,17-dione monooxygenase reductase component